VAGDWADYFAQKLGSRAPIKRDFARAVLITIDMQRDFLEPGGFGETPGTDVATGHRIRMTTTSASRQAGARLMDFDASIETTGVQSGDRDTRSRVWVRPGRRRSFDDADFGSETETSAET
jgi:hypothetical protein